MDDAEVPVGLSSGEYGSFLKVIEKIVGSPKTEIGNDVDLEKIIVNGEALQDLLSTEYESKPESFTKENIIEGLLVFLGNDKDGRAGRANSRTSTSDSEWATQEPFETGRTRLCVKLSEERRIIRVEWAYG